MKNCNHKSGRTGVPTGHPCWRCQANHYATHMSKIQRKAAMLIHRLTKSQPDTEKWPEVVDLLKTWEEEGKEVV